MLWDTGWWEPEGDPHAGLKKGHLGFTLHGDRLKGRWNLIRMRGEGKKENWLLTKEDDAEASKGANSEFLEGLLFSVTTGRSMDEIAGGKSAKRKTEAAAKPAKSGTVILNGITITHGKQPTRSLTSCRSRSNGNL